MGRRRTTDTPLTAEAIATEALRLIDDEGVDSFTLASLARRLGVRAPSLYNHVESKAAIVELIRDQIAGELDTVTLFDSLPWGEAMVRWAHSYRAAFAAHPNIIELLSITTVSGRGTLTAYEHVVRGLVRGGWPSSDALMVMTAVEAFVLGCALDLLAPEQMIDPSQAAEDFPALTAALDAAARTHRRTDAVFTNGLEALIGGLRQQLDSGHEKLHGDGHVTAR